MGWPKGKPRKTQVADSGSGGTAVLEKPGPVEWVRQRVEAVLGKPGKRFEWTVEQELGRERVEIVVDNKQEQICGQIAFITVGQMRDQDELGLHDEFFRDKLNEFMNEHTIL